MANKLLLRQTFEQLLEAITPQSLISQHCSLNGTQLCIEEHSYDLSSYKRVILMGSGKAVVPMAEALHRLIGEYIDTTLLVGAYDAEVALANTKYIQSTHPLPSQKSLDSAIQIQELLASTCEDELVIYLLSGGNSALVELPQEPITLEEFQETTSLMLKGGMPIEKINCVRKHLSQVKGGKLATKTKAKIALLVLSDVIGDDLQAIGSAPFYYDSSTFADAIDALKKYKLFEKIPQSVQSYLEAGVARLQSDTPKAPSQHVQHFVIGSNKMVLQTAKALLTKSNIPTTIITEPIQGDTLSVTNSLLDLLASHKGEKQCYILGGESTVTVQGEGRGGRNQHLCLSFLHHFSGEEEFCFLSAATDGIDGNSDATGALIDIHSRADALSKTLDVQHYLQTFNSNAFFDATGELLVCGPTHNNLLDIVMLLVESHPTTGVKHG